MKRFIVFAFILSVSVSPAFAKTLSFPNQGDTMFKVAIPNNWEPDTNDDEVVDAVSPDENIRLSIWEIESLDAIENWGNDVVEILKDHAKNIRIDGKGKEVNPGGMEGYLFRGDAVATEDDHAIDFTAVVIADKGKYAMVYIEVDDTASQKEIKTVNAILDSITPPGGKKVLRAHLAASEGAGPTTTFTPESREIHAFFTSVSLKKGDVLKGVWIMEDDAPKGSKVQEFDMILTSAIDKGSFSLSINEDKVWAVGKYRLDIYVNDKLVESLHYEIAE